MKTNKSERNIGEELIQAAKEIKAHKEGKSHPKVVSNLTKPICSAFGCFKTYA